MIQHKQILLNQAEKQEYKQAKHILTFRLDNPPTTKKPSLCSRCHALNESEMPASLPHLILLLPTFLSRQSLDIEQTGIQLVWNASVTLQLPSIRRPASKAPLQQQVGGVTKKLLTRRICCCWLGENSWAYYCTWGVGQFDMRLKENNVFTRSFLSEGSAQARLHKLMRTHTHSQHGWGAVTPQSCIPPSGHSCHFPSVMCALSNKLRVCFQSGTGVLENNIKS